MTQVPTITGTLLTAFIIIWVGLEVLDRMMEYLTVTYKFLLRREGLFRHLVRQQHERMRPDAMREQSFNRKQINVPLPLKLQYDDEGDEIKMEVDEMVDTSGLGGNYLSAKGMKVGDKIDVLVTGEGEVRVGDEKFKPSLMLEVKCNGEDKLMRINATNVAIIRDKLGKDTKAWINKTLSFVVVKTNFEGKMGFQFCS